MRLKSLRERANLTQKDVADAVGVARSTVAHWERGHSNPKIFVLPTIAKLLKCTIEDLYGEED